MSQDPFVRVYEFWNAVAPSKRETALKTLINQLVDHVPSDVLDGALKACLDEINEKVHHCVGCDRMLTNRPGKSNSTTFHRCQPHCRNCNQRNRKQLELAVTQ